MCLAYTTLQHSILRPDTKMLQTAPQLAVYYVEVNLVLDKTGCKHSSPPTPGRPIPSLLIMPLRMTLLHLTVHFF